MQTQTKIALIVGAVVLAAAVYFFSASSGERENVPVDTKPLAPSTDAKPAPTNIRTPGGTSATTPRSTGRPQPDRQTPGTRDGRPSPTGASPQTSSESAERLAGPPAPTEPAGRAPVRPSPTQSTDRTGGAPETQSGAGLATRGQSDAREASVDPDADTMPSSTLIGARPEGAAPTTVGGQSPQPVTPATAVQPNAPGALTPAAKKMRTHTVVEGDTFSTLALQFYGSQRFTGQLIQANPQVTNPDMLKIGMTLNVPELGEAIPDRRPTEALAPNQYRVRSGDSFASIAREKLGDERRWPELYEINKEQLAGGPDTIKPGTVIYLSEPTRQQ